MYELNGIMIVGEITPELKVVNARATNDWMMLVTTPMQRELVH